MLGLIKNYLIFFILICFISCSEDHTISKKNLLSDLQIKEHEILRIPLKGQIAERTSEISGLCWFGDYLILLPQYPERFGENIGKIFYIKRKTLDNYIKGKSPDPISPDFFTADLSKLGNYFNLGSGFEAITMIDNSAYLTLEHLTKGKTETILIKGIVDSINKNIIFDEKSIVFEPGNFRMHNTSCESILAFNNCLYPIFEAFGKNINSTPTVSVFDSSLNFNRKIDFPHIEYRITDVTSVDDSGKFWAFNYFYPGDYKKLDPAEDMIIRKFGLGESHRKLNSLERILQFQIMENSIKLSDISPIYLKLSNKTGRNWEGIAKYDNSGFIITTDTYPETILAYVKKQ